MRKISLEAAKAFAYNYSYSGNNTKVVTVPTIMTLHGNRIAYKRDGKVFICLCGWVTKTTLERLNTLLAQYGFHDYKLRIKEGVCYYKDKHIDSSKAYSLNLDTQAIEEA